MKKLLIVIFILGLLLRIINLGEIPTGFTPDEASFGYDAYSISKTGRDQWGNFIPLNLKSFGDYKLPVLTYLIIPFVKFFDLSVITTRLPNALLGSFSIIVTWLLAKEILDKKTAFWAATLLAISPWHIALSRGAFEANLTSFFLPLGLYFLYKKKYLLAATVIGVNLFTYHTSRLLTLPVVFAFIYFFTDYKQIIKNKAFLVLILAFSFLTLYAMLTGGGGRLATSSIFSISDNIYNERFDLLVGGEPDIINKILNNKFTYLADKFITSYLSYFSFQFLFTDGPKEYTYGMNAGEGLLYIFEIFTLIAAIYVTFFKKLNKKYLFVFLWILVTPIPAALTLGPGHAANRVAFMMPAIQIFSAIGLVYLIKLINNKISIKLANIFLIFIIILSFVVSFEKYWFGQKVRGAHSMLYGMEELVNYVSGIEDQYQNIFVTRKISEGYIYFAFFNKIKPEVVQNFSQTWDFEKNGYSWLDQQPQYVLGKYVFQNIDWNRERTFEDSLIIAVPGEVPSHLKPIKTINYLNNETAYVIIQTSLQSFALNEN